MQVLHICIIILWTFFSKFFARYLNFIYIRRRPQNFAKSSPYFWLTLHRTKARWRVSEYMKFTNFRTIDDLKNDCTRNKQNSPKICTIFSFSSWNLSSVLTSMSRVFLRKDSTSLSFSCKISLSLLTSPSQFATLSLFSNSSLKASKKDHSYRY